MESLMGRTLGNEKGQVGVRTATVTPAGVISAPFATEFTVNPVHGSRRAPPSRSLRDAKVIRPPLQTGLLPLFWRTCLNHPSSFRMMLLHDVR